MYTGIFTHFQTIFSNFLVSPTNTPKYALSYLPTESCSYTEYVVQI